MKKIITIAAISIAIVSCIKINNSGYKYNEGKLPETPVNLEAFNTIYDDYNSTAPWFAELIPFCFSTNRNSKGNDFDIIYQPMDICFSKTSGILTIKNEYGYWGDAAERFSELENNINKINTSGNEFGPCLITGYNSIDLYFTLMYASDNTGNFQINYISNRTETNFTEPKEVTFLNSEYDDYYPCFNSGKSKIYFCSNREENNFDFYSVDVDPSKDIETVLSDETSHEIKKVSTLNSVADDKCPFLFGDVIVFASNREGGYGGFDLYTSTFKDGEWSEPVNMGADINTEYDEYRPILLDEDVSVKQTMMVFSSNRPGGKGGFDLYFVGVVFE